MSVPEIIYVILLIAFFSFLVLKLTFFRLPGVKKQFVLLALYLKIIAGFGLTFIYSNYYPDRKEADIFKYFDDSEIMYNAIKENPSEYFQMLFGYQNDNAYFDKTYYSVMNNWYREYETVTYNDSHTIIRINAVFRLVSFGFFQVHNLFMIFLAFIGLTALFRAFHNYFKERPYELFFAVFLIPAVLFWSSGALKESLLLFGLGIFLYAIQQITFIGFSVLRIFAALFGIFLLFYTKMYVLAVLIPVLAANIWVIFSNNKRVLLKFLLSLFFWIDIAVIIGHFIPEYNVFALLVGKQHDFIGLAIHEQAGSFIEPFELKASFISFAYFAPMALINTLFRPFFGDVSSPLLILSLFENLALILMIMLPVFFPLKGKKNMRIIYFCFFFSILLFILLGLTTPVLGALVRYRIPALPFFIIGLFMLTDTRRILSIFRKKQVKSNPNE